MTPRSDVRVSAGARAYDVCFGSLDALVRASEAAARRPALVVVDERVYAHHRGRLEAALGATADRPTLLALEGGERSKTLANVERLLGAALAAGVERGGVIVGIGGGVVCDVTGFAAATYHRGIDWIAVPTTTLAMVDASVGGKTGVNLGGAKNIVGAFHQPARVLVDVGFLESLAARHVSAGLVEAVKIGAVKDPSLIERVEALAGETATASPEEIEAIVHHAVRLKAEVVAIDEREEGVRALLNFGHTVGHALEAATGFDRWLHGEAVSIGMVAALRLSVRTLGLARADADRVKRALEGLGAPLADPATPWPAVRENLARDKKVEGGQPAFVLTPRIGSGSFGHKILQDIVNEEVAPLFGGGD